VNLPTPNAQQERQLGSELLDAQSCCFAPWHALSRTWPARAHPPGDVLELAVFLSVHKHDKVGFQRHMAQLKPYYQDHG
jgi:hypothetical protein